MSNEPLRVLHVIGAMDRGGAETLVMNVYRNIDRSKIQFDFLVNESRQCDYDSEIESLGGKFYRIPRYRIFNYVNYAKACKSFFSSHSYQIVHGHIALPWAIYLPQAKQHGMFTIAHSHAQNFPLSPAELAFRASTHPVRNIADYFLACSEQAGIDRYGKAIVNSDKFHLLQNGIDVEAGRFNIDVRNEVRAELGISNDAPVFGHVGRLTAVKNHDFLLKTFKAIREQLPNAQLLLLGRGELEDKLRNECVELGLTDSAHFLGVRDDVARVLSAMDVFVFTSFKEGLSLALVEAQASGLPCLASTGVPELAKVRSQTSFLDLSAGAEYWAEQGIKAYRNANLSSRASAYLDARKAGYDIQESAKWLEDFYLEVAREQARH